MPGVYLSYPFCAQKCTYCNFASGVFPKELEPRYLTRLESHLAGTAWPWKPETVYWGGGTPSLMPLDWLRRLHDRMPGRPWREATMEAAPGTLTDERLQAWRESGITRVSLGVQSFVQQEIARTGRKHTAAMVEDEVRRLRAAGLEELNLDLIAGLAGQTRESWRESLDWIERLAPPHVSVYLLEVDEDSRLGAEMLLGGVRYGASDVPGEGLMVELYETAVERLQAMGIARYEISNFARPGHESQHNLKYWRLEPYLGFGSDAHSFAGGERWQNAEGITEYLEERDPPRDPAQPAAERFFVGLRLSEGIVPTTEEWHGHGDKIHTFIADGLLEKHEDRLRLTSRGILLSNDVLQEFLTTDGEHEIMQERERRP
ncbi:MAG: coproporphyrinogen III oxidase family protein [Bryobacteraceae bacterium]|nr:coproporphyrinogen III oxidase family protein [Bryobacteraceae bacterium]